MFVKFFINNIEKQPDAEEQTAQIQGPFSQTIRLQQRGRQDGCIACKVISVDMSKTLITSANLSYHGQQGNIELGALIESENTAKQLDEVMTQLIFKKIFREV